MNVGSVWQVQALKGAMEAHMGGGWYGYQNMPRSLKFQELELKVDMQKYNKYELQGWRRFLVT